MGNGYGSVRYDREKDFEAYDASPPLLRWLQQNAVAKWCARGMLADYRRMTRPQSLTPREACQTIIDAIERRERQHTVKAYGKSHPEAGPHRDH
jgi:hypothetical protein